MAPLLFAYVGVKECGCTVAAVADYGDRRHVGKSVDQFIRRHLAVERVTVAEARARIGRCKHSQVRRMA